MATLGIWKLIDLGLNLFNHKLRLLPFTVSIREKALHLQPMSKIRRYFLKLCTLCVVFHTLVSLTFLCKPIFVKPERTDSTEGSVRVVRFFMLVLSTLFPPAFLAMSYAISFTPEVAVIIINCIAQFQHETKGNYLKCCGNNC